jgi:hypothetical protein
VNDSRSEAVPVVQSSGDLGTERRWLERPLGIALLLLVCALLLVSRRPDAVLAAQFWAEDGRAWFADAHATGWNSLLVTRTGYFVTVSRLTAIFSLAFPLAWAPLVFNLVALGFKLLPVALLHSQRGRALVPDRWVRLAATLLYIGHPYAAEIHLNVTNIQWHLALSVLMLLLVAGDFSRARRGFDVAVVALGGLSGVFGVFLVPVAMWVWYRRRDSRSLVLLLVMLGCAAVQLFAVMLSEHGSRSVAGLGATPELAAQIIGGQLFGAALVGGQWTQWSGSDAWRGALWLPALVSILGLAWYVRAWWTGPQALRALLLLAALVGIASLLSPQISGSDPQWPLLAQYQVGVRYVFIPIVAWYAALLWCAWRDRIRAIRWASALVLLTITFRTIPDNWIMPPYQDFEFQQRAAEFEAAAPGTRVSIPINPPGWDMILVKPDA